MQVPQLRSRAPPPRQANAATACRLYRHGLILAHPTRRMRACIYLLWVRAAKGRKHRLCADETQKATCTAYIVTATITCSCTRAPRCKAFTHLKPEWVTHCPGHSGQTVRPCVGGGGGRCRQAHAPCTVEYGLRKQHAHAQLAAWGQLASQTDKGSQAYGIVE